MIVPSVQVAVASPFASVSATRGFVEPLPDVTASATATFGTGRPDASLTRTTSEFGIDEPTAADCVTALTASRRAGDDGVGETESLPHAATTLAMTNAN